MTIHVYRVNRTIRDSFDNVLDYGAPETKMRPYVSVPIDNGRYALVPLRSNCPPEYSIPIRHPDKTKPHSGLDFSKMLIFEWEDLHYDATRSTVNRTVLNDLIRKESDIKYMVQKAMLDYKFMITKKGEHKQLTDSEKRFIHNTTLCNFGDYLGINDALNYVRYEETERKAVTEAEHMIQKYRALNDEKYQHRDISDIKLVMFEGGDEYTYFRVDLNLLDHEVYYMRLDRFRNGEAPVEMHRDSFRSQQEMNSQFLRKLDDETLLNTCQKYDRRYSVDVREEIYRANNAGRDIDSLHKKGRHR